MALFQVDGIILKVRPFGEADKVMTILTPDRGKIEAVAKGARRPRNRFLGSTQPFTYLQLLLFSGHSLHQLNQAEILHSFAVLRDDLTKMANASYWCEMTEGLLPEDAKEPEVFSLLLQALTVLEQTEDPQLLTRGFEIKLLSNLGYLPELTVCVCCGEKPAEPFYFTPEGGGILGSCCRGRYGDAETITRQTIEALRYLLNADLSGFTKLKASPELRLELQSLLGHYIESRLERPLKSMAFLAGIEEMNRDVKVE
jgi:DNA repair protein RecO (recombination protein O)